MTAPTPLALHFTINDANVREAADHIKARAGVPLGVVKVGAGLTGTGAVTIALTSKPDWDERDDSAILQFHSEEYTVYPNLPPVAGVTSEYHFEATDSATPTPVKASIVLKVTTDIPAGQLLVERHNMVPMQIDESVWRLLFHHTFELDDRNGDTDRSVTLQFRQHVSDGRLIVHRSVRYSNSVGDHVDPLAMIMSGDLNRVAFCRDIMTSDLCTEVQARAAWSRLEPHFPPFVAR